MSQPVSASPALRQQLWVYAPTRSIQYSTTSFNRRYSSRRGKARRCHLVVASSDLWEELGPLQRRGPDSSSPSPLVSDAKLFRDNVMVDRDIGMMHNWKREWKNETATSRTYVSESVTVIAPGAGRAMVGGKQGGYGWIGLVAALWLAVKTARFARGYDKTVFQDSHKWIVVAMWPLLYATSGGFREEFTKATTPPVVDRAVEEDSAAAGGGSGDTIRPSTYDFK